MNAGEGILAGDVAMIYGAAGGIGQAVVHRYLREGATVFAIDRNDTSLERLAASIGPAHAGRIFFEAADASDWRACCRAVDRVVEHAGGIDIVVSCVGVYDHAIRLADIDGDLLSTAFDECFRINAASMLLAVKSALQFLMKRRGRIVLTSSVASRTPSGGGVLYTASKHAVEGIISQLAYELAPLVRVNGVAPGVARTVMSGLASLGQGPKLSLLPGTEALLPLGRVPEADEYGAVYALLGSASESSAMTGEVVVVDSGVLVRGLCRTVRGATH